MEPKKTEKADLANKSFLFLSIGLVISLLLAITAFSYRVYDDTSVKDLGAKDAMARKFWKYHLQNNCLLLLQKFSSLKSLRFLMKRR